VMAIPKPTRTLPAERKRLRAQSQRETARDKATADRLCSALVRRLAGNRCEAAGFDGVRCSPQLDWAHGLSRRHATVRWAHSNTFSLCRAHHDAFGRSPSVFDGWRAMKLGVPLFCRVVDQAREIGHVDIPAIVAALKAGQFLQGERGV